MFTRWSEPVRTRITQKRTAISCPKCKTVMGEMPDGKTIARRSKDGSSSYLHLGCTCGFKQTIGIEDVTQSAI